MNHLRRLWTLYLAFAAGGLLLASAVAQQITSPTLSGNEVTVFQVGGPGGTSLYVPVSQLRNAQGVATNAGGGVQAITLANNNTASLIFTAAVTGATPITAPPTPWDGQIFEVVNGTAATANTATITFTANTGQTVVSGAVATLAASTSAEWRYNLATTTWYRLR